MDITSNHRQIYRRALCYDVAFSFRDVPAECAALLALAERHLGRAPASVLELAAGPARHAREFARRGLAATALDSAPEMLEYAAGLAAQHGLALHTACADMTAFTLPQRFDLAVLPLDSASYLLDNPVALRHLACVARHLNPGGLYVLEMSHPRDAFGVGASHQPHWTTELDGLRVTMRWGEPGDAFDPVTQIDEVTVSMDWSDAQGSSGRLVERSRQRRFTANEVDALVRASGAFEIVEWLGALAPPHRFDNVKAARQMIPVLRAVAPCAP